MLLSSNHRIPDGARPHGDRTLKVASEPTLPAGMEGQPDESGGCASAAATHSTGKKRRSTVCCKTNVKRVRRSCPQSHSKSKGKLNEGRRTVTQEVGDSEGPACDVDVRGASSVDSPGLHVDSLPHTILLCIFKYLSLHDLLCVIALVSKRWRDMGCDPDLWRVINLEGQNKVTDEVINRLSGYSDNVRLVDVTDSRLVTNEGISLVAKRCTQLRVMKLIRYSKSFTHARRHARTHTDTHTLELLFIFSIKYSGTSVYGHLTSAVTSPIRSHLLSPKFFLQCEE